MGVHRLPIIDNPKLGTVRKGVKLLKLPKVAKRLKEKEVVDEESSQV